MTRLFPILFLLSLGLSGCSSLLSVEEPKELRDLPEISCVAVLPTAVPVANSGTLTAANKNTLLEGAVYLDSVMSEELGGRTEFKLLSQQQLDAILGDPWGGRAQQVRDIGHATRCGAVLETSLSKYRERVGTSMSIETPAAAAFSMELISVESGIVFWTSSFDETQKALFDDIFSFDKAQKRGFKWLSVQELSGGGLKDRLSGLPYFQEADLE